MNIYWSLSPENTLQSSPTRHTRMDGRSAKFGSTTLMRFSNRCVPEWYGTTKPMLVRNRQRIEMLTHSLKSLHVRPAWVCGKTQSPLHLGSGGTAERLSNCRIQPKLPAFRVVATNFAPATRAANMALHPMAKANISSMVCTL